MSDCYSAHCGGSSSLRCAYTIYPILLEALGGCLIPEAVRLIPDQYTRKNTLPITVTFYQYENKNVFFFHCYRMRVSTATFNTL